MRMANGHAPAYNVQTAVDAEHAILGLAVQAASGVPRSKTSGGEGLRVASMAERAPIALLW